MKVPTICVTTRMRFQRIRIGFSYHATLLYLVLFCSVFLFGSCGIRVVAADDKQLGGTSSDTKTPENPVPQVRYRTRPVAAFRSGQKQNNNASSSTNSSETDGPEPSGVPFIAVHDLTSQTFEKLHENWRNLETFIRNLQARRSQEESLRSSSSPTGVGVGGSTGGDTIRRPPYNNVYTFKYHPVVLEGEGSSSVDDIVGGNARSAPPRTFNGISFNPFPYDPKGEGSKNVDMEKHTVATIYTIGICLTIMVIGSVMFILINKCDGGGGSNYARASAASGAGNRAARSVIGATRNGRQINGNNNNGRSRNSRGGRGNSDSVQNASTSGNIHTSGATESAAKILSDLPPSYASLFPEGTPKLQEISELASTSSAATDLPPVIPDNLSTSNSNNVREVVSPSGAMAVES